MKKISVCTFLLVLLVVSVMQTQAGTDHSSPAVQTGASIGEVKGVVLVDDIHDNDYAGSAMTQIKSNLESEGFVVRYTSNFSTLAEGLSYAHYYVVSAPYSIAFTSEELGAVKTWFEDNSANLILASRGDYEGSAGRPDYASMNSLLTTVGAGTRVQDDNVYTTDPNAWRAWYIDTDNFNTGYSSVFKGVTTMSFFSPSSVAPGAAADTLVYAEAAAYQENNSGPPPEVIYDNTPDGKGGDSIPLVAYEEVDLGSAGDRVVVFGTTMWSNFDYGDSDAQDTVMFHNLLNYLKEETVKESGDIVITLPDNDPPSAGILYPRANATVSGVVEVRGFASDPFGLEAFAIELDGEIVSKDEIFVWNTSESSVGWHTVRLTASDFSGNTEVVEYRYNVVRDFQPTLRSVAKVMTYNIKESGVFPQWLDVVREENPDILILVETGDFDDDSNAALNEYVRLLNSYFIDEAPYYAETLQGIEDAWNGITLLSRFPINSYEMLDSLKLDSGSSYNVPLPFLAARLQVGGTEFNVIGGHLTCCSSGKVNRASEQEAILNYMDGLGDVPILYMGDMNSESPVDTDANGPDDLGFEPIEMVINSSHPRASVVHTFTDVFRSLNPDTPGYTFISSQSRIDYIFANQHFKDALLSSEVGAAPSAPLGSDHYEVTATIDFGAWTSDTQVDRYSPPIPADTDAPTGVTDTSTSSETSSSPTTTSTKSPLAGLVVFVSFVTLPVLVRRRK